VAIKSVVTVYIELSEEGDHASHTVHSLHSKLGSNFIKALLRRSTHCPELVLNIRIIASTSAGHPPSKLLKVKLARFVGVVFLEKSINLNGSEVATERFDSFCELLASNCTVAFYVEVFENLFDGLALVLCSVSLLANLFADNVFKLVDTCSGNIVCGAGVSATICVVN
jgi:hypothetical protein